LRIPTCSRRLSGVGRTEAQMIGGRPAASSRRTPSPS
jgi:hypothetical protein